MQGSDTAPRASASSQVALEWFKAHRAQLMRKMEADSVAQLVRIAEGLSLLPPRR